MRTTGGAGRWVLLLALAAGLVGMHHLAGPSGHDVAGMPPMAVAHHIDEPAAVPSPGATGMSMHPCLAVLAAVVLLGLLLLVVAVLPRGPAAPPPRAAVRTPARPPPRSAVRLALLCVLRN